MEVTASASHTAKRNGTEHRLSRMLEDVYTESVVFSFEFLIACSMNRKAK